MIESRLLTVRSALLSQVGARFVVLATTANVHNPAFYIGSLRQGEGYAAANFIFRSTERLADVITAFDGEVDAFLVDVEIKNELRDLPEQAQRLIKHSACLHIKPNDMTVDALDAWLTLMRPSLINKRALIVGSGNIGGKMALRLAERGVCVELVGRNPERTRSITAGLMAVMRGAGRIEASTVAVDTWQPTLPPDIILGCTPGTAGISATMVESAHEQALLIDVGNGTFSASAIAIASQRRLATYCLSPEAGFAAWVTANTFAQKQLRRMTRLELPSGVAVVGPGVLGRYGDIIVDDPNGWSRVIAVCNGSGDTLAPDVAAPFLAKIEHKNL